MRLPSPQGLTHNIVTNDQYMYFFILPVNTVADIIKEQYVSPTL